MNPVVENGIALNVKKLFSKTGAMYQVIINLKMKWQRQDAIFH
jgi:hypothetical protein